MLLITIDFINSSSEKLTNTKSLLKKIVSSLVKLGEIKEQELIFLSAKVVESAEMQEINKIYRNKDYATNVLSFPNNKTRNPLILGDVIICIDVAKNEALASNIDVNLHIARLWVHGILHLIGYDDEDDNQAKIMQNMEDKILKLLKLNVPTIIESAYLEISLKE